VTAGCSFTAGTSDMVSAVSKPTVWPHFVLSKLNPNIFNNLSLSGGGNISIASNLVYFLQSKSYIDPAEILIVFNISGLDRSDTMCPVDHPDANTTFSWSQDFGYGWITSGGFLGGKSGTPFKGLLQKNMGIENIITFNCLALTQALGYLEHRKFHYAFMVMDDQVLTDCPDWFMDVLNKYQSKWIQFEHSKTMNGHCAINGLLDTDHFHPSTAGHADIADHVVNFLNLS